MAWLGSSHARARLPLLVFLGALGCSSDSFTSGDAAPPDASLDVATDATDASAVPDTGVVPPPCDANEVVAPDGVFVSKDGNDATGTGAAIAPLASLGKAVKVAIQSASKNVYVAEDSYVEPAELVVKETAAGVRVHGGWKKTGLVWAKDCAAGFGDRTVIASSTNVGIRVQYASIAAPFEVEGLTLTTKGQGASPADASGESMYGAFVEANGALKLTGVHLVAGKAGAGGASSPVAPATGTLACDGIAACGSGLAVGIGGPGADAAGGTYAADGFHPADGAAGVQGPPGNNGTAGFAGASASCLNGCAGQCQSSDSCVNGSTVTMQAGKGKCGCGGNGGGGGKAGHGGGASIGAYVAPGAKLILDSSRLTSAGGGDGSAGGAGGGGASASGGSGGAAATCSSSCGKSGNVGLNCGCISVASSQLAGGAPGGAGSNGGAGGPGGAGAGGDAYAWVTFGTGSVSLVDAKRVVFEVGSAGKGAGNAPAGSRADSLAK